MVLSDAISWFSCSYFIYLLSPLYQSLFPWVISYGTYDGIWFPRLNPIRYGCLLEHSPWVTSAAMWNGNQSIPKKSPLVRNWNFLPITNETLRHAANNHVSKPSWEGLLLQLYLDCQIATVLVDALTTVYERP